MKLNWSAALGGYAAVMTLGAAYFALGAAAPAPKTVPEINVERINIREPDGTLRMTISSHARMPGYIQNGKEILPPYRPDAGMIFFNNEGSENGGLVFDGALRNGLPTNGGSLTFDRWHQDQTIQLSSIEEGDSRDASLKINDEPDLPADLSRSAELKAMPKGPARDAALRAAHMGSTQRIYLGRADDKSSQLMMRDAAGRPRLVLRVEADGSPTITMLDAKGAVARRIDAGEAH